MAADEQSYEEVINKLRAYTSKVFEGCTQMDTAGRNCVDNTDNDPAAERSAASLSKCIGQIREGMQKVNQIIAAMNEELEAIRAAAAKAESME